MVYDHFEDGYETDPYNPVQGSTVTLSLDDGDVWTQTSSIPVDQPGRGAGFFYDGRDRIVSSAPIAVTQTAYATTPGSLHAGAVEVLDLDKSGTAFDIPVGQNADFNGVFEYVGLMIVANQRGTAVQVDADADGSFETTASLDEGETHLVAGGVNLGARVTADHPVAVYVLTGDVGATYEGRDFELYPTAVWSSQLVSPVGARSTDAADGTRVFLFNPGASAVVVDVATSAGAAGTVNLAARGQGSFLMPANEGARFTARGGAPIYAFQAITTEGEAIHLGLRLGLQPHPGQRRHHLGDRPLRPRLGRPHQQLQPGVGDHLRQHHPVRGPRRRPEHRGQRRPLRRPLRLLLRRHRPALLHHLRRRHHQLLSAAGQTRQAAATAT